MSWAVEIHHMKGDLLRDSVARCLTMYSVTSSPLRMILSIFMPRCAQYLSPSCHYWILTGGRNRTMAFFFKAFGETLQTWRKGTRFNYLKTVCCRTVPTDRGRTSLICGTLGLVLVFPENVSTLWSQHLGSKDEKESSMRCLYKHAVKCPKAFPTVQISRVCFKWFLFLLFSYISICIA